MSVILGVETSGLEGLIALRRNGNLLAEVALDRTRSRHAQTLVSEVQSLLQRFEIKPQQVDLVATSIGPGSFTGLRVGVVFAKTFCLASDARLVAVDTLLAAATAAPADVSEVSAVADAMREEVFVGRYRRSAESEWQRVGEITVQANDDWLESVTRDAAPHFAVTGSGLVKLCDRLPTNLRRLDRTEWTPRAANICAIAEQLAARNEFADPFALEPFYLRKSAAEEKRDATVAS